MENKAHCTIKSARERVSPCLPQLQPCGGHRSTRDSRAALLQFASVAAMGPSAAKAAEVPGGEEDDWRLPVLLRLQLKPFEGLHLVTEWLQTGGRDGPAQQMSPLRQSQILVFQGVSAATLSSFRDFPELFSSICSCFFIVFLGERRVGISCPACLLTASSALQILGTYNATCLSLL